MEYSLKYGAIEEGMILASNKANRLPPDPIQNAPDVYPWLKAYIEAFRELKTTRTWSGMGDPMEVPWTAIDAYTKRHPSLNDDFDQTVYYIRALDTAWLKWHSEMREAEAKKAPKPKKK